MEAMRGVVETHCGHSPPRAAVSSPFLELWLALCLALTNQMWQCHVAGILSLHLKNLCTALIWSQCCHHKSWYGLSF